MKKYLPETRFREKPWSYYSIQIDHERGVRVYSECCCDDMSLETAMKVYKALGEYFREIAS